MAPKRELIRMSCPGKMILWRFTLDELIDHFVFIRDDAGENNCALCGEILRRLKDLKKST